MSPVNTVQDYLRTLEAEAPGLTCPACGSVLSMRRQGSTEMILTENVRLEIDGYLASHRRFLEKLELLLKQRTVYYKPYPGSYPFNRELRHYQGSQEQIEFKPGGQYSGISAEQAVERFIEEVDFFEWIENFYSFPQASQNGEQLPEASERVLQKAQATLLTGLEPRSIAGPIMDLVFSQISVSQWCEKVLSDDDYTNTVRAILQNVCPTLSGYLDQLQGEVSERGLLGGRKSNPELLVGIRRLRFILVILLGHHAQDANALEYLAELGIAYEVPFTLPRKTVVSPKHLKELFVSEPVLGNEQIGLPAELLKRLKQATPGQSSEDELEQLYRALKSEIHRFVHFACTGPVSDRPSGTNSDDATEQSKKRARRTNELLPNRSAEPCGWYPKTEPTHSVILLGSPGTGKSSVMLTGFTTFYDNVSALGATVSFESPEDEALMKEINDNYWAGRMPRPTPKGSRTSIKLALEFPGTDYPRTHYVFTDVAGEVMARSLTEEGSDPAVLRILKNAETIVFFFDLSIEPSIRQKLMEGDDGTWSQVKDNYERVAKSRQNLLNPALPVANNQEPSKSRAEVSQLQLLQKLIGDLRVQYQRDNLRDTGLNFICVIPKIDLFAHEGRGDRYFFTPFVQEMKNADLLVQSNRVTGDDSFSAWRSIGGTMVEPPEVAAVNGQNGNGNGLGLGLPFGGRNSNGNGKSDIPSPLQRQCQISQWITRSALGCLQQAGQALGEGTVPPIKASLQGSLQVGLIDTLHHVFGEERVYFLPVSAQGKDSEQLDWESPPNQKLSEYVFLLPVALSTSERKSLRSSGSSPYLNNMQPERLSSF